MPKRAGADRLGEAGASGRPFSGFLNGAGMQVVPRDLAAAGIDDQAGRRAQVLPDIVLCNPGWRPGPGSPAIA